MPLLYHSLSAMYVCAHLRAKGRRVSRRLRSETSACGRVCKAKRRIARWSNLPFLRHFVPSKGLTTEHRHPDRSPGTPRRTVFFPHFQQRKAMPFTWPTADRSRSSAGTGIWSGEGLPISCRGWYNKIDLMGRAPAGAKCPKTGGMTAPPPPLDTLSSQRAAMKLPMSMMSRRLDNETRNPERPD